MTNFLRAGTNGARMMIKLTRSILSLVCAVGAVAAVLFGGAVSTAFAAASLTPLGFLSNDSPYIEVHGVSANGSVVVGTSFAYGYGYEAFRWTSDGGMVGLDDLPGGEFFSKATGVSADGSVIAGTSFFSGSRNEAFGWTSDGGMVGLGDLPGGGFWSRATSVSADGSVIVGVSNSASGNSSADEAFRWTSDGGMVGLGKLPGGSQSEASGVSGDGSIVVGVSTEFITNPSIPNFNAFYWTADSSMQALWDVLLSYGVDPAADGWTSLLSADGISADGTTIVGVGERNGNGEAFVAVIPTIAPELAGDFDGDGDVDAFDLGLWQTSFGIVRGRPPPTATRTATATWTPSTWASGRRTSARERAPSPCPSRRPRSSR